MKKYGIVAFAFGAPADILSNKLIAKIALEKAKMFNASVYTQRDILINGVEVEYAYEKSNNPSSTLRMARGAVDWAKRNGIEKIWIVAAKPHLWRCQRDLVQAVKESETAIKIHFFREIEDYPEDLWFCLNSTQQRTRSKKSWESREWILKLLPFNIYKLIANR